MGAPNRPSFEPGQLVSLFANRYNLTCQIVHADIGVIEHDPQSHGIACAQMDEKLAELNAEMDDEMTIIQSLAKALKTQQGLLQGLYNKSSKRQKVSKKQSKKHLNYAWFPS